MFNKNQSVKLFRVKKAGEITNHQIKKDYQEGDFKLRKHTNEEILGIVENEELEYTVTSYLSPESVEDKKWKELIINARKALENLEEYLREVDEEVRIEE